MNDNWRWNGFYSFIVVLIFMLPILSCKSNGNKETEEKLMEEPLQIVELTDNWYIQSSKQCNSKGEIISISEFSIKGWYNTPVPTTVFSALVRNGLYGDIFYNKRLEQIPSEQFSHSWWFRKEFELENNPDFSIVRVIFEGINYKADMWLNGHKVASKEEIVGAFRMFDLDVSRFILPGKNILALEIFPPVPGDFTIGFVDWNPTPPDNSMGLWRPVKICLTGAVSIEHPFVQSQIDIGSLKQASLTIRADLTNHSNAAVSGNLMGEINSVQFSQTFSLSASEKKEIIFSPENYQQLNLKNPLLWWPHNLGKPNLYPLKLTVFLEETDGLKKSDYKEIAFGIRNVKDYINSEGYRGYSVNGKKMLIRGAGWVDDMLLSENTARLENQFKYIRHMNLNTIRLEGFWGSSQTLYELADKYGILIMAGWSCQWEWENLLGKPVDEYGGIKTSEDINLMTQSLLDQVTWLRHHPSILVWVLGSDKLPRPQLEKRYIKGLKEVDPSRPYLASCKLLTSEISGSTAVKMNGPYDYVPPIYWYIDKKNGGAFGFNTETGPGPQPPPLESLKRMLPVESRWPISESWTYYCARNMFNTITHYKDALEKRYGEPTNLDDFARTAQLANYEAMRAMFEAFAVSIPSTTGIIQWMLNSAWPSLHWQLYDYYLMPNGAFYGAKKANNPLHIVYNYGDKSVYIVNDTNTNHDNLNAEIQVFNFDSREIFFKTMSVTIERNESKKMMNLFPLKGLTSIYFLALRLNKMDGTPVADNFYWLSQKEDVLDEAHATWFYTPQKGFADFHGLRKLPMVSLDVQHRIDTNGDNRFIQVILKNPGDKIAFFIELKVIGEESGRSFLPVFWDDNYFSLLPGETRTLGGTFSTPGSVGGVPVLTISGWNLK